MIPRWYTRPLTLGDRGEDVAIVQRKVGAPVTGVYDEETAARIRGVQMSNDFEPSEYLEEEVAELLGESATQGLVPEWYAGELNLNDHSPAVCAVRCRLGVPNKQHDRYDADVEAAVRRFQSGHGLPVTGVVDEATAIELGECVCQEAR